MNNKIEQAKGKLIVSCQALPEEPLHSSFIMGRMAKAAKEGGASGIARIRWRTSRKFKNKSICR